MGLIFTQPLSVDRLQHARLVQEPPYPQAPNAPAPTTTPTGKPRRSFSPSDPELEAASDARSRSILLAHLRSGQKSRHAHHQTAHVMLTLQHHSDGKPGRITLVAAVLLRRHHVRAVSSASVYATEIWTQMRIPLDQIKDWSFDTGTHFYGGFTVHLLRSRMSDEERTLHDARMGMPYGPPEFPLVSPLLQGPHASLADSLADPMAGPLPPDVDPNSAGSVPVWAWRLLHEAWACCNRSIGERG